MIMAGVKTVVWLQKDPLINVSMLQEVAERDGACLFSTHERSVVHWVWRYTQVCPCMLA